MTIDTMIKRNRGEFAGITNPKEVGELMAALRAHQKTIIIVGSALMLSTYLFPRSSELRGMRWDEIDWDKNCGAFPASG